MTKFIYLAVFALVQACSSIPDLSFEDRDHGEFLFNRKLKQEYTNYFGKNIFRNGSYVYAGPAFYAFNNFQLIKVTSLSLANNFYENVYTANDGSRHEYLKHVINAGWNEVEKKRDFMLNFNGHFQSFSQVESAQLTLRVEFRCKKDIKCHLIPNIDFHLFSDPYDFSLKLYNNTMVIDHNVELSNFSPSEATAIGNRMIYIGMSKAAANLAIGEDSALYYAYGYYNVQFNNDVVSNFEFRMRHDLPYFIRR